ncbi:hypothetical protein KY308_03070 [Candidatus Woesearchaeota archaeon]|nr:hypothetical protein [Candidatus Woesearchaeota archaeon]
MNDETFTCAATGLAAILLASAFVIPKYGLGVRSEKVIDEFKSNGRNIAVIKQDVRFGFDRIYARDNGIKIYQGEFKTDDGRIVKVSEYDCMSKPSKK